MVAKKGGFTSGIGFALAAAGSAVGLGNLWAFPYKTAENGGAAFLFLYIACVLFIGVVTMICEIFLGRRAQANPVTAIKKINKNFGWIGLIGVVVPFIITCYYSVLGGYTVKYAFGSLQGNTDGLGAFAGNGWLVTLCTAIFLALAVIIVMAGIKSGIERMSKVLMPVLFLLLVGVVIFVLCLGEGVAEGLKYYLVPDFSKVTWDSVLAAMGQSFYSLSLGMGAMVVYGSYTGKEINIFKSTAMICVFDSIVALLAGLAIFPAVFHFAVLEGVPTDSLQLNGLMLMFETLPKVFESIGIAGNIIEFVFFSMVIIAAVTSVISILEAASQFIIQKFRVKRKLAVVSVALCAFVVSIPVGISLGNALVGRDGLQVFGMDMLSFLDAVTNIVFMPVCAFFSCVAVGWLLGTKKAIAELEGDGYRIGAFKTTLSVMVKFVVPALIAVIEIFGLIGLIFPDGVFSLNGAWIAIVSYALFGALVAVYFAFFKKGDTGCNADEVE
jgi:NSS family neurotransmitter:Na+ symporter